MRELKDLSRDGRLLEFFGCGTAAVIAPVERIGFQGQDIRSPTMEHEKPVSKRLFDHITDIQYGRIASHTWAPVVC